VESEPRAPRVLIGATVVALLGGCLGPPAARASEVATEFKGTDGPIYSLAWAPNGRTVASAGNRQVNLWRLGADAAPRTFRSHTDLVRGLDWSPHGRVLASAHGAKGHGAIRLWNPASGRLVQTLTSPGGWLRGLSWSPDGLWLAAGGEDGQVRIWNVETQELAATLATDSQPVWSLAWSPDGRLLAAGNTGSQVAGGTVSVWDAPVRASLAEEAGNRTSAVEMTLLKRAGDVAPMASRAVAAATVVKDGGAYGTLTRIEPPFGNLETSLVESDLRSLGIAFGDTFHVRCREKTLPLVLGTSVDDVARGEWVAFFSLEGSLMLARYFGNAAEASGCEAGDGVFVSRLRQN